MFRTMARALFALLILAGIGVSLGACNTVAGAGTDLHNGSRDVQKDL